MNWQRTPYADTMSVWNTERATKDFVGFLWNAVWKCLTHSSWKLTLCQSYFSDRRKWISTRGFHIPRTIKVNFVIENLRGKPFGNGERCGNRCSARRSVPTGINTNFQYFFFFPHLSPDLAKSGTGDVRKNFWVAPSFVNISVVYPAHCLTL